MTAVGHQKFSRFQPGFFNDLDGGVTFIPDATMSDGKHAYKLLYPYELIKFIQSEDFKRSSVVEDKKKGFEIFVKALSENANPVILVVKLKQ